MTCLGDILAHAVRIILAMGWVAILAAHVLILVLYYPIYLLRRICMQTCIDCGSRFWDGSGRRKRCKDCNDTHWRNYMRGYMTEYRRL